MKIIVKDGDDSKCTPKKLAKRKLRRDKKISKIVVSASGSAATAITDVVPQADFQTTLDEIHFIGGLAKKGDLTFAEFMLVSQAQVLQSVFSQFITRMATMSSMAQVEAYSKIALRAQNQCQRTLKTFLEYKNPKRATFIKQQNNAVNQQINEGDQPKENPEKKVNPANKLLEVNHEARLDTGKAQGAITVDSELETVGELDRTSHGTG